MAARLSTYKAAAHANFPPFLQAAKGTLGLMYSKGGGGTAFTHTPFIPQSFGGRV